MSHIADVAITAGDLVRHQTLFTVPPATPVDQAREELDGRGFTSAPLTEIPISRFVSVRDLRGDGGTAAAVSRPIEVERCINETQPLSDALTRLRDHEVLFVRHHRHTTGVLTSADLEQPAVSLVVLGFVTSAEAALDHLIDHESGGDWLEYLSQERRDRVRRIYADRQRYDADLSMLRCLNLDDRLTLVRKLRLFERLGFASRSELDRWKEELGGVRNVLAHGDTLLAAQPDPRSALDVLAQVRDFTRAVWTAVDDIATDSRAHVETDPSE